MNEEYHSESGDEISKNGGNEGPLSTVTVAHRAQNEGGEHGRENPDGHAEHPEIRGHHLVALVECKFRCAGIDVTGSNGVTASDVEIVADVLQEILVPVVQGDPLQGVLLVDERHRKVAEHVEEKDQLCPEPLNLFQSFPYKAASLEYHVIVCVVGGKGTVSRCFEYFVFPPFLLVAESPSAALVCIASIPQDRYILTADVDTH